MVPRRTLKLILDRSDVTAYQGSAFTPKQSSTAVVKDGKLTSSNSAGNRETIISTERTLQLVLDKCDYKGQTSQSNRFKTVVKNEFCDASAVRIKVENDVFEESVECGNDFDGPLNSSFKSTCDGFEEEEQKGQIVRDLVGYMPEGLKGRGVDIKPLLRVVKLEPIGNSECETGLGKSLDNCVESNACVGLGAMEQEGEEEKEGILRNLVRHLPKSLKGRYLDRKLLVRLVRLEDSSEAQSNTSCHSFRPSINRESEEPSTVRLEKIKILSKPHQESEESYSCSECSYKCRSRSKLIGHLKLHGERLFECKACPKKFKSETSLKRHGITHINNIFFKCFQCVAKFRSKVGLEKHLLSHSDQKSCPSQLKTDYDTRPFSCFQCGAKFKKKIYLKRHLQTHSSERPFKCSQCDARFKSKNLLRSHSFCHSDKKPFSCPRCPYTSRLRTTLNSHIYTKHSNGRKLYTCAHCSATFRLKSSLAIHMISHSTERPHSCSQCPMAFKSSGTLKTHLKRHSDVKPYSCQHCPATFRHGCSLKYHLTTHSNAKPFSCPLCPAKFKVKGGLRTHKAVHLTERPFCCGQCSLKFKSKLHLKSHIQTVHIGKEKWHACSQCSYRTHSLGHLKAHILTHNNEQPFECEKCDTKFKTLRNLELHRARVHSDQRLFSCNKCPKTFKGKNNLNFHLLRHSTENRHACDKCTFTFRTVRSLEVHSSVHTDERKYCCALCTARFRQKDALVGHLRVHSGEKPYACMYCSSRFTQKHSLSKHLLKQHSNENLTSKVR